MPSSTGIASMKLGIATRLFLAFAGIAALSLASGGVGWWILNDVETAQTTIVERAMPAVSDARLAAEIAGRIVARSPRLTNAATETERETQAAAPVRAGRASPAGPRPQCRVRLLRHRARDVAGHRRAAAREPERAERAGGGPDRRHRASDPNHRAIARSSPGIVRPVRDPGVQRGRRHHRGDFQSLRAGGVPGPHRGKPGRTRPICTKWTCS